MEVVHTCEHSVRIGLNANDQSVDVKVDSRKNDNHALALSWCVSQVEFLC